MTQRTTSRSRPLASGNVYSRIQSVLTSLIPSDRKVADALLAQPDLILTSSVTDVARQVGVASSTIIRACQSFGFRGFQDLRLALARDLALQEQTLTHVEGDITAETDPGDLLRRILHASSTALLDAANTVDSSEFAATVAALAGCSRLLVIGNGTSSKLAADAAFRFTALGLVAQAPSDAIGQHLTARLLSPDALCLVVSHTGATKESLAAAEAAHTAGARVAAITSFARSPLTELAAHALVAGGPENGFRLEAMTSRLAHMAILDALFVGVAVSRPERSTASLDFMADVTTQHSL